MAESESAAVWAAVAENDRKARKQWLAGYEAAKAQAAAVAGEQQTMNWAGGDDWAAGFCAGKDKASRAILAMEPRDENA